MTESTLSTAPLGSSGMRITRVGFGAWAIGGGGWAFGWGVQDDDEAVGAIRYAIESGVNWIDTAAAYGLGHSEEIVARALRDFPVADRPYVFTKCGLVWDAADRLASLKRIGAAASLRMEIESSLRRLEVEQIDLWQMHWPAEDGTALEEYWQTMLDIQAEGKVRAVGLSNHDTGQLDRAEAIGHVDSLQPPFSAIHRESAELLPWTVEHQTGVIVYSPMQAGLLTGAFSEARVAALDEGDWRRKNPDFTSDLAANLTVADGIKAVAEQHDITQPAAAVAWTLAFDGVTGAIVGGRNPKQVNDWLQAGEVTLTDAELTIVAEAIGASGAGEGPVRPTSVR